MLRSVLFHLLRVHASAYWIDKAEGLPKGRTSRDETFLSKSASLGFSPTAEKYRCCLAKDQEANTNLLTGYTVKALRFRPPVALYNFVRVRASLFTSAYVVLLEVCFHTRMVISGLRVKRW